MSDFFHEYPHAPLTHHPPAPPPPPHRYPYAGGAPDALPQQFTQRMPALETLLPRVQQALRLAQTAAPYIKQYYPLVRQLPFFLKMLSAAPASTGSRAPSKTSQFPYETSQHRDSEEEEKEMTPPPKLYV
ncbi:VrrA/YqfQ family protein [Salibacterium lacus]|uniref:VrrA/YqfQ family protein n=1 Tax=Salibacterium lacus TaxID=1898109 RepID=A0ABW5SYJ3_9BACI